MPQKATCSSSRRTSRSNTNAVCNARSHPSPLRCAGEAPAHTLHPALGTTLGRGRDNLHKGELFGLLCENRTQRQPGRRKGVGLSPREGEVGADPSVNVPDSPIFPPPHNFIEGGCPEASQKAICRQVFKNQIMTSGIQLHGLHSETAVPGCIFLGRGHSIHNSNRASGFGREHSILDDSRVCFAFLPKVDTCILLYNLKTKALFLISRPLPCQKHQSSALG